MNDYLLPLSLSRNFDYRIKTLCGKLEILRDEDGRKKISTPASREKNRKSLFK
ncbi:MAG: hypothetical protein LE169_05400 [Endomicrobium sp.]|nr:hypothetical protein [Endomicrobium sp.]